MQNVGGTISLLLNLCWTDSDNSVSIFLKDDPSMPVIFCRYPFLFTLNFKVSVFKTHALISKVLYV